MKRAIARLFLRLTGWKFQGEIPVEQRCVLIAAPHTSNWDLPYMLAFAWYCGIDINWMGKHQIFAGPQSRIMKALGGVPVRRDQKNDLVTQMVQAFDERDTLFLTIPPEATRQRAEHWKSGFYRIALAAGVPIIPTILDYRTKTGGFGAALHPTGNISEDMDVLRATYSDCEGKYPENFGPIRLAEEADSETS